MDTVLGIDIGSTNIKAAVYDLAGNMLCFSSRKNITHHSAQGFSEYDAEEIWEGVCSCLKEIIDNPACGFVCSIGISSLGESNVLIDKNGRPCYPVIAWFDQRAVGQTLDLESRISKKTLYEITGQILSPKFGLCKLLWIKENVPEALKKAYKCLSIQDYIIYRLTGAFATDYSLASRMLCFDIRKLAWSRDILSLSGIPQELLPDAYPGASKVGAVSSEAAASTGLVEGTPVFTGGHDHACAAIAVNIFEDGTMLNSMGTAETSLIATNSIMPVDKGYDGALCIYPHFGSKLYRVITSMQACGASIEWFLHSFGAPSPEIAPEDTNIYERLLVEAELSAPKSGSIIFLPYIRGLQENPMAKGAFVGIDDACDRGCFIRAISEGICFELRRRIESCERAFNIRYDILRAVGGLSKSPRQMKLKASITGKQIEIPECNEAACYGAALLGAIGAGIFAESDLSSLYRVRTVYMPSRWDIGAYDSKYKSYLQIQDSLCKLYTSLG